MPMSVVAGFAVGDDLALGIGTVRPILFGMMNGTVGVVSWPGGVSGQLLTHLNALRAKGTLRTGPMPDTYNEVERRARWLATSASLESQLALMDDLAAEAGFIRGLALEVHEELVVDLEVTREEAGVLMLRFDPPALAYLEDALR